MKKVETLMRLTFATICVLSITFTLQAGTGAITVAPAVVTLRGDFGQSTTQRVAITNSTSGNLTFEMKAEDVLVRDGQRVFVAAGATGGSIAGTAVFSQQSVTVAPDRSAEVDVTITIPPNATHRAVVILFNGAERMKNAKGPPMIASIGTLLTFNVTDRVALDSAPPVVRPQTAARNFGVSQPLTNSGAEPLIVHGVAAVLDGNGSLVGRIDLPQRRFLPGEKGVLVGDYIDELAPGKYRILITFQAEGLTKTTTAEVVVP